MDSALRILLACYLAYLTSAATDPVVVNTTSGAVQGIVPDINSQVIHFYGIPYAKPPIGKSHAGEFK